MVEYWDLLSETTVPEILWIVNILDIVHITAQGGHSELLDLKLPTGGGVVNKDAYRFFTLAQHYSDSMI